MKKLMITLLIVGCLMTYYFINNQQWIPTVFTTYSNIGEKKTADTSLSARHYQKYCSGCHGEGLENFTAHQWKNGKTKSAIFKAIKYGYANDGMPAYDTTFTDKEIYDLSDFIVNYVPKQKSKDGNNAQKGIFTTNLHTIKVDTVVADVGVPWSIAFLPNSNMLVTDRSGRLLQIDAATRQKTAIQGVPVTVAKGQGGFFDVMLHPDFANNQLTYLAYSKPENGKPSGKSTTAILQGRLQGNILVETKDIFVALPYSSTHHHYGGRMTLGKDGCLYFSVGERGNEQENPQNTSNHLGKIHRIHLDGSIPGDNPFVNKNNAAASIWCYGNRNPQGLITHPATGDIWANEHGPMGGDEINLIQKGHNYGWPVITYGVNYNGTSITDKTSLPGMDQPHHFWVPSIAVSGMAIVTGNRYPKWAGNLLNGSLKFKWISRCTLEGQQIVAEESMMKGVDRLRDIRISPDGFIYLAVEDPGMILKLLPQ